jgi:hypothetical protein
VLFASGDDVYSVVYTNAEKFLKVQLSLKILEGSCDDVAHKHNAVDASSVKVLPLLALYTVNHTIVCTYDDTIINDDSIINDYDSNTSGSMKLHDPPVFFENLPVLKPSPFDTFDTFDAFDAFDTNADDPLTMTAKRWSRQCTLDALHTADLFGFGSIGSLGSLGSLGELCLQMHHRTTTITVSDGLSGTTIASFCPTPDTVVPQHFNAPDAAILFCSGAGNVVIGQKKVTIGDDVVIIEFSTEVHTTVRVVYICRVDMTEWSAIVICTGTDSPYIGAARKAHCFETTMRSSGPSTAFVTISMATYTELSQLSP